MINRLIFGICFLISACAVLPASPSKADNPTPWSQIRRVEMRGNLKIFWAVNGGENRENRSQAIAHGFEIMGGLNTYADYPGKQKENINNYLRGNRDNPWNKPSYFEKTVKKNLNAVKNSIFFNDIEFAFEKNINKAWANREVREASGAENIEEFKAAYLREWASWFYLPCKWAKEDNPNRLVGLYGIQVFDRDYYGFLRTPLNKIREINQLSLELWQHIDPYVDFYIASIYVFYDSPGSIYYMAANVEENYLRSRRFSNKPLYPFIWLRYHDSNRRENNRELDPYLVEAAAVVPFFTGAKGLVVWGWEPKRKGQYYHNLPIFMNSVSRVADLSDKISRARLIIDEPAYVLWRKKRPLIRKLRVSAKEWIVMAVYPWQREGEEKEVKVNLGGRSVELRIDGRHTEIYHLRGKDLDRLTASAD